MKQIYSNTVRSQKNLKYWRKFESYRTNLFSYIVNHQEVKFVDYRKESYTNLMYYKDDQPLGDLPTHEIMLSFAFNELDKGHFFQACRNIMLYLNTNSYFLDYGRIALYDDFVSPTGSRYDNHIGMDGINSFIASLMNTSFKFRAYNYFFRMTILTKKLVKDLTGLSIWLKLFSVVFLRVGTRLFKPRNKKKKAKHQMWRLNQNWQILEGLRFIHIGLYGKNNKPNTKLFKEFGDTIALALQNKGPICKARDEYLENLETKSSRLYSHVEAAINAENAEENSEENSEESSEVKIDEKKRLWK